jgi:hypothetical protein
MNPIKQSIWRQDTKGEWKLFFNTEYPQIEIENTQKQKSYINKINPKTLNLGTLVMTPDGIGRLLKIENQTAKITMSKTKKEEHYPIDKISNYFVSLIKVYDKEISNWFRINLPVNGNVETLKKILIEMKIVDLQISDYLLVTNGTELKDEYTFEQLSLKSNCKILLCGQKLINCKVNRFNQVLNWWYSYNMDGITFSCNKKIKLTGIGMYGSHEGKTQNGTLKIYENDTPSNLLCDEIIEISPAADQSNAIVPINFKKPIVIRQNIDYTIQFQCSNYCYLYYGNGGIATVEGEKGVEFYFKFTQGSAHGTNVQSGNFPELYYYA